MPKSVQSVAFVSTMDGFNWGGSEELWSRTAVELCKRRLAVSASVVQWDKPHRNIRKMEDCGVNVWPRPQCYPFWKVGLQRVTRRGQSSTKIEVEKMLKAVKPSLIVLSAAAPYPPADLMELCISKSIPFVTIGHANWDTNWVDDEYAGRCRKALASALRCYFVSMANLRLTEKQLGHKFTNPKWSGIRSMLNTTQRRQSRPMPSCRWRASGGFTRHQRGRTFSWKPSHSRSG